MNHKSEMMAQLVPQLEILLGREKGDEISSLFISALQPYDLVPAERSVVIYDNTDKGLVGRFFVAKTALGLSEKSLKKYKGSISCFLQSVGKHIKDITTEDVRLYLMGMKHKGRSAVTQNNVRLDLSSFFSFLYDEGLIEQNPLKRIKKIRTESKIKEPFTESEVELLRQHASSKRDRAIIDFLISTGCRISEMCSVNKSDINWDNSQIMIKGKGSKFRIVYLNARAMISLKTYLDSRTDSGDALFVSRHRCGEYKRPRRFKGQGVRQMLHSIERSAGVDNVHPHRFRRTAATLALRRGMPIEQVAKILGHAKLDTTTIYANSTQDDLAIAHRRYLS
ncbi:MAG: tyrosine-type recombinase/integrase [Muribaculaceae bacterium]|nr:tyrosine-type recombinase/integrase [Muribaculaceae bacterium]